MCTGIEQTGIRGKTYTQGVLNSLKGWREIASFLGQPISVAQRWAKSGMPVVREGRLVYTSREELDRWLGRESEGEVVHVATQSTDLVSDLKKALSYARKSSKIRKQK